MTLSQTHQQQRSTPLDFHPRFITRLWVKLQRMKLWYWRHYSRHTWGYAREIIPIRQSTPAPIVWPTIPASKQEPPPVVVQPRPRITRDLSQLAPGELSRAFDRAQASGMYTSVSAAAEAAAAFLTQTPAPIAITGDGVAQLAFPPLPPSSPASWNHDTPVGIRALRGTPTEPMDHFLL